VKKKRKTGRLTTEEFQANLKMQREAEDAKLARLEESGHSGKNQSTVYRGKDGKKVVASDMMKQQMMLNGELPAEQKEAEELDWRMGKAQKEEAQRKHDRLVLARKMPLNQYADDPALEAHLKARERKDDPMLAYMRKRQQKQGGGGEGLKKKKVKPIYTGAPAAPTRHGTKIKPGYRWDGVDRSNGFEQRLLSRLHTRKSRSHANYQYSVRNM